MPALPSLFCLPISPRCARCQSTNSEICSAGCAAFAAYNASITSRPPSSSCRYSVTITMRRVACAMCCSSAFRNAAGSGSTSIAAAGSANEGNPSSSAGAFGERSGERMRRARRRGVVISLFMGDLASAMAPIIANHGGCAYPPSPAGLCSITLRLWRAPQRLGFSIAGDARP